MRLGRPGSQDMDCDRIKSLWDRLENFLICSGDFFAASYTMNGKLRNPYETCTISLESSIKKNRML